MNIASRIACSTTLSLLAAIGIARTAQAQADVQDVGSVATLSGVILVRSAQGVSRLLAVDSHLSQGDTLTTDARSYAKLRFDDDTEITLAPNSVLVVTRYSFDAARPELDRIELGLAQGGLQSAPGRIAQRSPQSVSIQTPQGALQGAAHMIVSLQP